MPYPLSDVDVQDIRRFYRAIADREPNYELLQMTYDLWGARAGLRPPADEQRLAGRCAAGGGVRG